MRESSIARAIQLLKHVALNDLNPIARQLPALDWAKAGCTRILAFFHGIVNLPANIWDPNCGGFFWSYSRASKSAVFSNSFAQ